MPCLARAITFDQDISNWDLRSVQDLGRMFDDAQTLSDLNRDLDSCKFLKERYLVLQLVNLHWSSSE